MEKAPKNLGQRWVIGVVVEIDLLDDTFAYAQILTDTSILFFDILRRKNEKSPSVEEILRAKPIFEIAVYPSVLKYWPRIGKVPVPQDYVHLDNYSIDCDTGAVTIWKYEGGKRTGTLEEIKNLESVSVWEAGAVEQRLRDYFAGRPCWYLRQDNPSKGRISAKEFYAKYGYDFHWLDDDEKEKP